MSNPYKSNTPEWNLYSLAESAEALARSFDVDEAKHAKLAEEFRLNALEQRVRAENFRGAIKKITITH